MAKLGYVTNFNELDCVKAEMFAIIESEINAHNDKEAKKSQARSRMRK